MYQLFKKGFFCAPTGGGRRRRHRRAAKSPQHCIGVATPDVCKITQISTNLIGKIKSLAGPFANLLFEVSTFDERGACSAFCALFGNLLFSTLDFFDSTFNERPVHMCYILSILYIVHIFCIVYIAPFFVDADAGLRHVDFGPV